MLGRVVGAIVGIIQLMLGYKRKILDLLTGYCGMRHFAVFSFSQMYNICSYESPWECGTPRLIIVGNGGITPRSISSMAGM